VATTSVVRRATDRSIGPLASSSSGLIEAGKELAQADLIYTDLTRVFEGNDEILYADDCCHLNARGDALMAQAIVHVIQEALNGP
jgi:hypothetical protein